MADRPDPPRAPFLTASGPVSPPETSPPRALRKASLWPHLVLFAATLLTTTLVGTLHRAELEDLRAPGVVLVALWTSGVPFSLTLLGILLAHEMGHFLTARRHRVNASLPYFIPFPLGIGTLGAIIKMQSVPRDRGILLDIGAMGPLVGMAVAVPLALIGLAEVDFPPLAVPSPVRYGDSILTWALTHAVFGDVSVRWDVTPVAHGAWLGLFITALNLLPAGQFDGGHILYGLLGERHGLISHLAFLALVLWGLWGGAAGHEPLMLVLSAILSAYAVYLIFSGPRTRRKRNVWIGMIAAWIICSWTFLTSGPITSVWLVWSAVLYAVGLDHPPTRDLHKPLDLRRRIMGWFAVAIFILTFIPRPITFIG